MSKRWIIAVLLIALAGCGRPDFGSTNAGGEVVDVDVDREPAGQNNGKDGAPTGDNAGGNNAGRDDSDGLGSPPDEFENNGAQAGEFAFDAYAAAATHGRNAVVAPHGIARSLVVAFAAADEATSQEVAASLAPYLGSDVYDGFNNADLALSSAEDDSFDMLASVWLDESVAVDSSYAENLARYLGLELRLLDIGSSPEDARNQINNWYGEQTDGRISEVIGARTLTADSRFVVTDATWLATSWAFGSFDPGRTMYDTFAGTETNVQLPMMQGEFVVRHFGDETLQMVELPLSNGFSLLAVLPADFEAFEGVLDESFLRRMMEEASDQEVRIALPRLEVSDRVMLSEVANTLGSGALFSDSATYSAFADGTVLDDAYQRTRISLHEEGIELSAGAEGDPTDGDMSPPAFEGVDVSYNRPFFFAVYAPNVDQFVYLGRITQP